MAEFSSSSTEFEFSVSFEISSKLASLSKFSSELVASIFSSFVAKTFSISVFVGISVLSAKDWCAPRLFRNTLAKSKDNVLYNNAPEINPKTYFLWCFLKWCPMFLEVKLSWCFIHAILITITYKYITSIVEKQFIVKFWIIFLIRGLTFVVFDKKFVFLNKNCNEK